MYSYLIRRLSLFFSICVLAEIIELAVLAFLKPDMLDLTFSGLIETLGLLMLTSTVSFLYLMLPYVFYLLFLPPRFQNGTFDKYVTTAGYSVFVIYTVIEEGLEVMLLTSQNTRLDFSNGHYLSRLIETYHELSAVYPMLTICIVAGILSLLLIVVTSKYLFTGIEAPKFGERFYHTVIYLLICGLAYMNIDLAKLDYNPQQVNSNIAEEGGYKLIHTITETEINPMIEKIRAREKK